jgi:hypothetical protein
VPEGHVAVSKPWSCRQRVGLEKRNIGSRADFPKPPIGDGQSCRDVEGSRGGQSPVI